MRRTTKSHTRRALAVLGLAGALLTAGVGTDVAEAAPAAPAAPTKVEAPAQAVTPQKKTDPLRAVHVQAGAGRTAASTAAATGTRRCRASRMNVEKPCTNCYIT